MTVATQVYVWQAIAIALLLLPLIIAGAFAIAWRRSLLKPWAFFILGSCVLFVVYLVIGELVFTPAADAYMFVPRPGSARAADSGSMTPFFMELLPTPVTLIVVAFPVLWWLRNVLGKRKPDDGQITAA
jgi:hypothetical protein